MPTLPSSSFGQELEEHEGRSWSAGSAGSGEVSREIYGDSSAMFSLQLAEMVRARSLTKTA